MTIRQQAPANGVPTWIDFMCRNLDGTGAFFRDLLGWTLVPGGEEFGGYTVAQAGGQDVTGFAPAVAEQMPDVQTIYLATDDIEATVAKARELGASVMDMGGQEVMRVADHGSMAVIADPTGATVGLWQADRMIGCQAVDQVGAPCWFEVMTRDVEAARSFYSALFGVEFTKSEGDPSMDYYEAKRDGETVFGLMAMPPEMPAEVPAHWLGYYQVDDVDAAVAEVQRLGGGVVAGPNDIPEGRWVNVHTPDGAVFALFSPAK